MSTVSPAMYLVARISNCVRSTLPENQIEAAKNSEINRRMKELYREGARRFRTIPRSRNGEDISFYVVGWPS